MQWRWYWKSWEKCEDLVRFSWRLTQALLLIGTVLPLVLVVWKLHAHSPLENRTPPVLSSPVQPSNNRLVSLRDSGIEVRPLLPYSVIPGGARDTAELRSAIAHDPVVAMHYVLFDVSKTRIIRLDRDRAMYVSYRMGDHVYWTRKKLMLLKGEALLTDGEHLARTRCGNRLSDVAELPTSLREPERALLETPPRAMPALVMATPPELQPSPIGSLTPPPPESGGHLFIPPIVPIFWGSGTPETPLVPLPPPRKPRKPPGGPVLPPPAPPPIVGIPEPSTLALLGVGIGALGLAVQRRRGNEQAG